MAVVNISVICERVDSLVKVVGELVKRVDSLVDAMAKSTAKHDVTDARVDDLRRDQRDMRKAILAGLAGFASGALAIVLTSHHW